jgi:hypothetical protein
MSTYRNEECGFELDLPKGWSITTGFARIPFILSNVIQHANILEEFSLGSREYLNIVVESMLPEPPPDVTELLFTLQAQDMGYTDVDFDRITVGGRDHTCVRYTMNSKACLKKYLIVLNGHGYAITVSCRIKHKLPESEKTWDGIAASLRLLGPMDASIEAVNNAPNSRRTIEQTREMLKMRLAERMHK